MFDVRPRMVRDGRDGMRGPRGFPGESVKGDPGESIKGDPGESIKGEPGRDGRDGRDGLDAPIRPAQSYRFSYIKDAGVTTGVFAAGSDGRDYLLEIHRDDMGAVVEIIATPEVSE